MNNATPRQKQLLKIIYDYIKTSGYPPTVKEMRDGLKVTSNQSVLDLLEHLEKNKLIKRREGMARSLAILPLGYETLGKPPLVPFLGVSHAGAPLEPVTIEGDWQTLPGGNSILKDQVFLLKINGDSMINAGIDDGDYVLVEEAKEFVSGELVLADVDGKTMIKRFISEDKPPYLYLKPENPKYDIIYFTEAVKLKGKVIKVIHH